MRVRRTLNVLNRSRPGENRGLQMPEFGHNLPVAAVGFRAVRKASSAPVGEGLWKLAHRSALSLPTKVRLPRPNSSWRRTLRA